VCDLETSIMRRPWPALGRSATEKKKLVSSSKLLIFRRSNCIYTAFGIVTVCWWLSCAPVKKEFFLNRCTEQSPTKSDDTRGCIYTITT